jgi:hypothetical protein
MELTSLMSIVLKAKRAQRLLERKTLLLILKTTLKKWNTWTSQKMTSSQRLLGSNRTLTSKAME